MPIAENQTTGAVEPAKIGFFASPVMIGITLSILFKLAGTLAVLSPRFGFLGHWNPDETEVAELAGIISNNISLLFDAYAWFKRKYSPLQPVVIGGPSNA